MKEVREGDTEVTYDPIKIEPTPFIKVSVTFLLVLLLSYYISLWEHNFRAEDLDPPEKD